MDAALHLKSQVQLRRKIQTHNGQWTIIAMANLYVYIQQ